MAKLSASQGKLYLGGEILNNHIGFNSFFPFEQAFTLGTEVWKEAIDIAASLGSKVLRVPIAPRYKNNLQTYVWTYSAPNYTLRASYITLVNSILDYALSKNVSLLIIPFFRFPDAADVTGETVSQVGVSTSLSREYMRQILAQMLTEFGDHAAIAGWCMSNEVDTYAWGTGGTLSINVGLGTPASYSVPADHLTHQGLFSWTKEFIKQVKTFDSSLFIINGHAGNSINTWGTPAAGYWKCKSFLYPPQLDAVSTHLYYPRQGSSRNNESYKELLKYYRAWDNRPHIMDEIGTSSSEDSSGELILDMYKKTSRAGVALVLDWQLCPASMDATYGTWINETRGNQRFPFIQTTNSTSKVTPQIKRERIIKAPKLEQVLNCGGAGNAQISIPSNPQIDSLPFSLCVWSKPILGTSGATYRQIVQRLTSSPNRGFVIQHMIGSHVTNYGAAFSTVFPDNGAGGTSQVNTNGTILHGHLGKWKHYTMTFDGTNLWTYIDGIPYGNPLSWPSGYTFSHVDAAMLIGQAVFVGQISDVRFYNKILTQQEMFNIIENVPANDGLVGHWPLNGDALDYSGYNNHGTASGDFSFVENKERLQTRTMRT